MSLRSNRPLTGEDASPASAMRTRPLRHRAIWATTLPPSCWSAMRRFWRQAATRVGASRPRRTLPVSVSTDSRSPAPRGASAGCPSMATRTWPSSTPVALRLPLRVTSTRVSSAVAVSPAVATTKGRVASFATSHMTMPSKRVMRRSEWLRATAIALSGPTDRRLPSASRTGRISATPVRMSARHPSRSRGPASVPAPSNASAPSPSVTWRRLTSPRRRRGSALAGVIAGSCHTSMNIDSDQNNQYSS